MSPASGRSAATAPVSDFASENPPSASVYVFVSVTSVSCPSAVIVSDEGENDGVHVPGTVGRPTSSKLTTVPYGRVCGPSTDTPSALTVSIPAWVADPFR